MRRFSHEQAATFNFNEKVEASSLKLAGGGSDPSDTEPDQTIKSDTDEIDSSKSQEPTNTDKPKEEPEEKPQDNQNIQPEPQNRHSTNQELPMHQITHRNRIRMTRAKHLRAAIINPYQKKLNRTRIQR